MACLKQRLLNLGIAVDQFLFVVITLGSANPDETISAAAYRLEKQNKRIGALLRPFIDFLFWFDEQHCKTSYENEISRKHLGFYYRSN